MNILLIFIGKLIFWVSQTFNFGSGSTWPGHIALTLNKNFIRDILTTTNYNLPTTILIAGTNGKTTTGKLIQTILEQNGSTVFQNEAGANLLNGIASTLIQYSNIMGKINYDYAVFEVDENSLPPVLNELSPDYLILLNLFRDQLDRYGEVNSIAKKWKEAISNLLAKTTLILNADDPQIASLRHPERSEGSHPQILYFGLNNAKLGTKTPQHAADSTYCPKCNSKLVYKTVYFSHLGNWQCNNCGEKRPKIDLSDFPTYPLPGIYNRYNTLAAVLVAKTNNISNKTIEQSLKSFSPAFGRQEIIEVNGKKVQIFLSKNPTSFNQSLRTISELKAKNILIVLNDRIPDGRDVSWIWDVDFEEYINQNINIVISGGRCYDMGLRIKYTIYDIPNTKYDIRENLQTAITLALDKTPKNDVLYILPTYSAMLETRKILTGKKIL